MGNANAIEVFLKKEVLDEGIEGSRCSTSLNYTLNLKGSINSDGTE